MSLRIARLRWDDIPLDKVTEMVACKRLGGTQLQLTQAYFKKGARTPRRTSDGEVLVYVLQGVLRILTPSDDVTVREGEVVVLPANVPHETEAFDDTFVMVGKKAEGG
jgi:quercetin dioxygenase-like cupin family protein